MFSYSGPIYKPFLMQLFSRRILQSFSLLIFILVSLQVVGQRVEIQGFVLEGETDKGLEFANVSLLKEADSSFVTGTITGRGGRFSLEAPDAEYLLEVSFIGYQSSMVRVVTGGSSLVELEPIRLYSDAAILEEVTVSSIRSMFRTDAEKRVYDVENLVLAQGGSVIDLLETLPSIQIDDDGNVSMRGSGDILILINGRPSTVSGDEAESILAQFPASSVKSIEIITNPSSRYDAAGIGGIINIILKENTRRGFNGQVEASAGTRHKYGIGSNVNYGTRSTNYFLQYNYQYRELEEMSETVRRSQVPQFSARLDQDFNTLNRRHIQLLRAGLDRQLSSQVRGGVYGQFNQTSGDRYRFYNQRHLNHSGITDSLFQRTLTEDMTSRNMEAGLTLDWQADTSGRKLFFTAMVSSNQVDRVEWFEQAYFYLNDSQPDCIEDQRYERPRDTRSAMLQLDYTHPLNRWGTFEGGLKSLFNRFDDTQIFEIWDPNGESWDDIDTISNRFQFDEDIHAAYALYRGRISRVSVQAGLRAEMTITSSLSFNNASEYENDYFNLFPSAFLSYEMREGESVFVNYSRRINRPSMWRLASFYNVQDPLNQRLGNPALQPELTDSYEAGYNKAWTFLFFTAAVYHRRTDNLMTRYYVLDDNNAVIQKWQNANSRINSGMEVINQFYLAKWLDLNLTGNFFHAKVFGDNIQEGFTNENFTWTLNLLGGVRLGKWGTMQFNANYRGPIVLPQGEIEPIYSVNAGYRTELWNSKATLALNVTDIFNTRVFRIRTIDQRFDQFREFDWETQIGTLTFTYRFGGFRQAERERRNGNGDMDDPF